MEDTPLLKMANIHKLFGKVHALKGVDFTVDSGEIVGLIGDNGAGKSTLIKVLTGVTPKNKGEIYWEGEEADINSVKDARDLGIETVYQDQAVARSRTVVQNVFMGREMTKSIGPLKILDQKKMKDKARGAIDELGLSLSSVDQEVRFCSGGERQGVAIARALLFEAELVVLDEPTTALSASGSKKVLDFVRQLKEAGSACVFITHNLRHVYPVSDRFTVLARGEKIADVEKKDTSMKELEKLQLENAEQSQR